MSNKYMEYEDLVYYDKKIKEYIDNSSSNGECDVTKSYVDNQDTKINNKIGNLPNLKTNDKSNIVNAINELFQNVDNGKDLIASAITDKGIDTSKDDTFETMANNISSININVIHNAMESLGYDYTDLSGLSIDDTARLISKCFILKPASENVSNIMSATAGVNFNNFLIDGKLQDFGNVINPVYTKETINQTKNTVNNVFVSDDISVEVINVYMGGV